MGALEGLGISLLAWFLEWMAELPGGALGGLVTAALALAFGVAHWLQARLNHHLTKRPGETAPIGRLEARFSVFSPLALLWGLALALLRSIRGRILGGGRGAGADAEPAAADPANQPLVVATLGPTFLLAGIVTLVLFGTSRLASPLLARAYDMPAEPSFWQYLFFGQRTELVWILPLEERPGLAVVLCLILWMVIWWTLGNLLRGLVFRTALQRNLAGQARSALPLWAQGFGVDDLTRPAISYRQWSSWLLSTALFFLGLAATTLGRPQGGADPATLSVALVVLLSWVLHLRLEGTKRQPAAEETRPASAGASTAGWPEVVEELQRRHQLAEPRERLSRPLPKPAFDLSLRRIPSLSPLLEELLPDRHGRSSGGGLSSMQAQVLERVASLGFVHLDRPADLEALGLQGPARQPEEEVEGSLERDLIVLAPESSGRSTLALLAAANEALTHCRSTLVVHASSGGAEEAYEGMRAAIEPSTLRWNLRVRRLGRDFAADLSRGILPDIVVVDLQELVLGLLDNAEVYRPFLHNVGLIVVDDVDSFHGSREVHAQLAFRRLRQLFAELKEAELLGAETEPLSLVLGADSMKETAVWAKALCGAQAGTLLFPRGQASPGLDAQTADSDGPRQRIFFLEDLREGSGRSLRASAIIGACEARGVPWHFRLCGAGRRSWGRRPLWLPEEPQNASPNPTKASVLLLEGRWSEVRRELHRLLWGGQAAGRSEVAIVLDLQREDVVAFEALVPLLESDPDSPSATDLGGDLQALPLPIVRPPSGEVVQAHLLADLMQRWIEVADLVGTFEAPVARCLRRLEGEGLLFVEERRDVRPELKEYESRVYVRAQAAALAEGVHSQGISECELGDPGSRAQDLSDPGIVDKVRQVDLLSPQAVAVRNRVDQAELLRVEPDSAGLVFYPGRIFESSQGRFVVVDRRRDGEDGGSIEVEPVLHEDLSSPRWRVRVEALASETRSTVGSLEGWRTPELVLYGSHPVSVGFVGVGVTVRFLATFRLDRHTGEIQAKDLHGDSTWRLFQPRPLPTRALLLHPNPGELPAGAPRLRVGEARLLVALLRFVLPLVYRDIRDQLEVALVLTSRGEAVEAGWNETLEPDDGIYLFDLHRGGNGTARAIYRDSLLLPLRLCRHLLNEVDDLGRIRRLHDAWADLQEILVAGEADGTELPPEPPGDGEGPKGGAPLQEPVLWPEAQEGLRCWLDSRLHPEPEIAVPPSQAPPPQGPSDEPPEDPQGAPSEPPPGTPEQPIHGEGPDVEDLYVAEDEGEDVEVGAADLEADPENDDPDGVGSAGDPEEETAA